MKRKRLGSKHGKTPGRFFGLVSVIAIKDTSAEKS